jgi:hypothetical protein
MEATAMPTTIVRSPKDPAHPFAALDKRLVEDSTLSSTIATTGDFLPNEPISTRPVPQLPKLDIPIPFVRIPDWQK